jgi:protein TonB
MITARIPLAAAAGVLCSLAVFFGLWRLLGEPLEIGPTTTPHEINIGRQIFPTPIQPRPPRIKPEPEPRQPIVAAPGIRSTDDPPTAVKVGYQPIGVFGRPGTGILTEERGIPMGVDGDVTPVIKVNPVYPPPYETRGIEGWVHVQFDVTSSGAVRNAFVVASEPGGEFDEAALEAVARWRYNPRIVNGTAVDRVGLQTKFLFTLDGPR